MEHPYFSTLTGRVWNRTPHILLLAAMLLGGQVALAQANEEAKVIAFPTSTALQVPGASAASSEVFLPGIDPALVAKIRNRPPLRPLIPFLAAGKVLATPAIPPYRYGSVMKVPGAARMPEGVSSYGTDNEAPAATHTTGSVSALPATDLARPATGKTVPVKGRNLSSPRKEKAPARAAESMLENPDGVDKGLSHPNVPILNLLRHQMLSLRASGILTPAQAESLLAQLEMIEAAIEMQQPMTRYRAKREEAPIDRPPEDMGGITRISPNPFRASTRIVFDLPAAATVTIQAYNPLGQAVTVLNNAYREAGRHEVSFEAAGLAVGTYTIRLSTDNGYAETRRVVLIR